MPISDIRLSFLQDFEPGDCILYQELLLRYVSTFKTKKQRTKAVVYIFPAAQIVNSVLSQVDVSPSDAVDSLAFNLFGNGSRSGGRNSRRASSDFRRSHE